MTLRANPLAFLAAGFLFLLATPARAQYAPATGVPQQPSYPGSAQQGSRTGLDKNDDTAGPLSASMEARRLKLLKEDRRKHLQEDAQRLLDLATQLKAEVDSTTKDELNVTVVKKAAEMEKLARDLKDRMRY